MQISEVIYLKSFFQSKSETYLHTTPLDFGSGIYTTCEDIL